MNKIKCTVCGLEIIPEIKNHYISRNTIKTGLCTVLGEDKEPELFDTFDCPQCGSQIVVKGRKRAIESADVDNNDET